MKLIELAIVQVIGNLEDEKTFSILFFMKSKLWNHFAWHLDIAICMFAQDFFTKETFPFHCVIKDLNDGNKVKVEINA
jgi:hypothetical protein